MTWEEIQLKSRKTEIRRIALLIIILLLGLADELFGRILGPLIFIDDYSSITLAVITVQATVATLVITILSLMANKMDAAYMGVSINDFLLNIKPWVFKQKRIIILEIALIVLNVFLQIFGCFNVVIAVFVAAMILMIISIQEIYEAFLGTEAVEDEIKYYLVDPNASKELIKEKLSNFTKQWKREIDTQSEADYQEYTSVFDFLFSKMFEADEDRKFLQSQCVELSKALLSSANEVGAFRGIDFINNCYLQSWSYIRDHQDKVKENHFRFELFSEVCADFINAFEKADIKKLEKEFNGEDFIENIIQNSVWMMDSKNDENITADIRAAQSFCGFLGSFVATSPEINKEVWGSPLNTYQPSLLSSPEQHKSLLLNSIYECLFDFMLAQIRKGYYDLIREYWYPYLENHIRIDKDSDTIYCVLKLHCYIYYLAYCETTACVDKSILDAAREFIESDEVCQSFSSYIDYVSDYDKNVFDWNQNEPIDLFNEKLQERMHEDLRRYELMPGNFIAKRMLMDDVTLDFVTFLSCYIGSKYNDYHVLDSIIPEDRASLFYIDYVQHDRIDDLNSFFKMMGVDAIVRRVAIDDSQDMNDEKGKISTKAQAAYSTLIDTIENKYKEYTLREAHNSIKISEEEYKDQKQKGSKELIDYLKKNFSGLISDNIVENNTGNIFQRNGYSRFVVLRVSAFSDSDVEKCIADFQNDICTSIANTIINGFHNAEYIDDLDKSHKTDDEWIEFLNQNKDVVVFGSSHNLWPKDYHNRSDVRKWLDDQEQYTNGIYGGLMIIKKGHLKLNFRNVEIKVRPETIDEAMGQHNAKPNPETGMYRYAPSTNMEVDFTESELKQYLEDKRRIIDVILDIGVEVDADKDQRIGYRIV